MDVVKKEMKRIKDLEKKRDIASAVAVSLRSALIGHNDATCVPLHDDKLNQIMLKLTGSKSNLHVISITGMAGIGKTTLAKTVYNHQYIVKHFDSRGWITVSQTCDARQLFFSILDEIGVYINQTELENLDYHQLGERLHKHLIGRRYLIIIDDLWSIEAWDQIRRFLPDSKGSGILITTRLSHVATILSSCGVYEMDLLDDHSSWKLLLKIVFGQENCPHELEEIGRKIAKNCKGLPLSISVIGGLLVKSEMKQQYWELISKEISTTVNSEDNERCLKILSLSYFHLPVHLRPCFLYMGMFPEDHVVRVSEIIRLWIAEGFLKPIKGKSLEEVAKDYFIDLVERNLILVTKVGCIGDIKRCRAHDLLWDFCLREGQKLRFLYTPRMQMSSDSRGIYNARRIASPHRTSFESYDPHTLERSPVRSVLDFEKALPSHLDKFILLRVLLSFYSPKSVMKFPLLVNLRYINGRVSMPSSANLFWNLHTITLNEVGSEHKGYLPIEIWKMPQLMHVKIKDGCRLRYPEDGEMDRKDIFVLQKLLTLSTIFDFKCTSDILHGIPNIQKLKIWYYGEPNLLVHSHLNNLSHFHQLQSLQCVFPEDLPHNVQFPLRLKKLGIFKCRFKWEELTGKVGWLLHLEKLSLQDCCMEEEWNPVDGHFKRLKFLEICSARGFQYWNAESIHFPRLEKLVLKRMFDLVEIPHTIGEIETLESIHLIWCSSFIVDSAHKIIEEQHSHGNVNLSLRSTHTWNGDTLAQGNQIMLGPVQEIASFL